MRQALLLISILTALLPSSAQQMEFRKVKLPEPVRHATLDLLYTDRSGFLWMAAGCRLYRYNGLKFHETHTDTAGRPEDVISALYEDSAGKLWVGWQSGHISHVRRDSAFAYEPEEGTPSAAVVAWAQDEQNQLWMATYGEGLYVLAANGRWYQFGTEDGLPGLESYDLISCQNGVLLATDRGLVQASFEAEEKRVEVWDTDDGLSDQIVKSLFKSNEGVWLGYYEQQLDVLKNGKIRPAQQPPATDCHLVLRSGSNTWWLSEGGRLYKSRGESGWMQVDPGGEGRMRVEHLAVDHEEHLWISTNRGLFVTNQWQESLVEDQKVTALALAGDSLWYAHDGKLLFQDLSSGENQQVWEGEHVILNLFIDHLGRVWGGSFDAGLFMYNPATGASRVFDENFGIPNNNVLSVTGDSAGLWMGTLGGAGFIPFSNSRLGRPQVFAGEAGKPVQYIYAVATGAEGEVFLATDGDGILRKKGSGFEALPGDTGAGVVLDLTVDQEGRLWWIDPDGNLYSWTQGEGVQHLKAPEGERGAPAGVEAGPTGNICVFHEEGIHVYFPQEQHWTFYGSSFGFGELQPELHAQVLKDGRLYLGTSSGITSIDMSLLPGRSEPATFLMGVELFFKPVTGKRFAASENHLSFNYIGRWYTDPDRVRYRIMLEGYDLEWNISQNTSVTYPQLPPGTYTFKVVAGIDDHFPEEELQTWSFSIAKPWYLRWYSLVAAVLLTLAIIAIYMRLRLQRIRFRQEQEKERVRAQYEALKSQVNPHFLFNSFNTLMALIEDDRKEAGEYLEDLSDFFRNILQYREVDLYSLREELQIISTYLKLQEKRFGANLQVEIDVPQQYLDTRIPPLSLQLLLENVFKHNVISRSKPLRVKIFVEDEYLVVWNLYQEKSRKESSTGYGLQSIKKKYSFYSRKAVNVEQGADFFAVHLPILKNSDL